MPYAKNWWLVPTAMLTVPTELGPGMTAEASDTTTEASAGGPTLSVAVPVTVPVTALNAAVMVEVPWLWLAASPVDAPITPTVVFDELQVRMATFSSA